MAALDILQTEKQVQSACINEKVKYVFLCIHFEGITLHNRYAKGFSS